MTEKTVEHRIAEVMYALRAVVDPELGLNIVELGLIRDVQIREESGHIVMILTTPFCPYAPMMLEEARETAERALGMPVTIEVGMEMWDPSMAEEGIGTDWGLY